MRASIKAKSILAAILGRAGINSWMLGQYSKASVAVLMYHRVIPAKAMGPAVQAGMVVEPDTLDVHLQYLRKHFDIIPLSRLALSRRIDSQNLPQRPQCVLTFDDGWLDFYQYAYPILKMYEAPATVFLPTDFVGTDRWFWTDRLGFLLERAVQSWTDEIFPSFQENHLLNELVSRLQSNNSRLDGAISLMKHHRIERIEEALSMLSDALGECSSPPGRAFLSWEEVEQMARSGIVSFGSHTAGHQILTTITEEQVRVELRRSMDALVAHKIADHDFMSFSYPNGNFSERLSEMVREAGYHLAVTTQHGWHHHQSSPYTIKRIPIHQDLTSTKEMFGLRVLNLL